MATDRGGLDLRFVASAAVTQYYVVELAATGKVNMTNATTDVPLGVAQEAATADGDGILVRVSGTTKAKAGGAINPGSWVGASAAGKVVAMTTDNEPKLGQYIGTSAAADGDIIEVLIRVHE